MQTFQRYLRTYRDEIKGIAILWVVFFHAQLGLTGVVQDFQNIGYGGVDLFFFLSGFGLFHSLNQNSDAGQFLLRRAKRLLPAYWPFCLIWLMVMIPLSGVGLAGAVRTAMGNWFMTAFFSGAPLKINWYPSALLLSLVIAPFFAAILRPDVKKRALMLIAACIAAGAAFIDSDAYMAISRLPVFVLGMAVAGWKEEKPSAGRLAVLLSAGLAAGLGLLLICFKRYPELLNTYGMYWHPFVLITPGLCAGLGLLFSILPSKLLLPLKYLGKASFEIFLFNAWVEVLGKRYGLCSSAKEWFLWSAASILMGVLYHLGINRARILISKKTQKNY